MTNQQIKEKLENLGLKKRFVPYQEPEDDSLLLKLRAGAIIHREGTPIGQIDLYDDKTFRVRTARVKTARALAKAHNLKIEELDKECEVYVPVELADEVLPKLGARVKVARGKGKPFLKGHPC